MGSASGESCGFICLFSSRETSSPTSLTSLFAVLLRANLWSAVSGRGSAGFDPRFPVIPDSAELREGCARSLVPAWQGKGGQNPSSALFGGGGPAAAPRRTDVRGSYINQGHL